jgi:O-antigen/teichoic acid export membrane protein
MLQNFLKDSFIYAIPTIFSRGLAVFLIPLYTRVLSPSDFGSFDLFMAFCTLVNLTVALEVSQGVARYYSSENDPNNKVAYASSAFWFTFFCYSVFLAVSIFFSKDLSLFVMGRDGMAMAYQIGSVYIFLNGVFYLIQNQFRWELRSLHFAFVSLVVTSITAISGVVLTFLLGWGLYGLLLAMTAGVLVGCIYGLWYLRNSFRFTFQLAKLNEMLVFSSPLVPSGIAVFISLYIDRLMISHYLSLNEVGLFGLGYRVASMAGLVMVGFQGALTPLIYKNYKLSESPSSIAFIFRYFVIFALLLCFLISVFSTEIIQLISTQAYYSASSVVIFLTPAILLSNMYIFAPGITIAKKTYLILYINIVGALLNAVLNFILVPQFGIIGAAISTLLTYIVVFLMYMHFSQKFYYVPHQWFPILTSTLAVFLLGYAIPKLTLPFLISLALKFSSILLIFMFFIFVGLINLSEIHQVKAILKNYLQRMNIKA